MAPTNTREISHPGSAAWATRVYAKRGTLLRRVKFFIETSVIPLALAALSRVLARGRVDLAELYELIVGLATYFGDKSALMADVL